MKWTSLQIGRFSGIPLQVHWTFLLVPVWIFYMAYEPGYGLNRTTLFMIGGWVVLVFSCVILHEFGHAIMAKRLGIATQRIVLYPLGGGAFLERMPDEPRQEIKVAMAGPLVNILLALLVAPLIWWDDEGQRLALITLILNPDSNVAFYPIGPVDYLIGIFFLLNVTLAFFNLLPAYPLDGGRIFRAALSWVVGRRRATYVAATLGIGFGLLFMLLAYWRNDWLFGFGAALVIAFAAVELLAQQKHLRLSRQQVDDSVRRDFTPLYTTDTVADARALIDRAAEPNFLIFDEWQQVRGVLSTEKLWNTTTAPDASLADLMTPQRHSVYLADDLLSAAQLIDLHHYCALPVLDKNQKLVGLLDYEAVSERARWRWETKRVNGREVTAMKVGSGKAEVGSKVRVSSAS